MFCSLRGTNYQDSTPLQSYRDYSREELRLKQLAQGCTCAPGNNPSRGPWALLSEFHHINAPHISVTQSLNPVLLSTEAVSTIFKVFWYDSVQIIKRLIEFELETFRKQGEGTNH